MVYAKSPGGIVATARRVERCRAEIEEAAEEAGVDPDLIEGMVLLESAGRPDARASDDLEGAVGLTQILAQTATGLLGMQVDVSERAAHPEAATRPRPARGGSAPGSASRVDERFDPEKSLAATGRYLKLAMDEFGREDLAVVSYHMGIGNLQQVLGAYGDDDASYAQVFFDTSPDQHPRAYRLLAGLGDDSKTYFWRVLASREVMRLYRDDRARLERLARLQEGAPSGELVLHPPGPHEGLREQEDLDGGDLGRRAAAGPDEPARTGCTGPGQDELFWGLRPRAFELAVYMARGVRNVSGTRPPLTVTSTVRPGRRHPRHGLRVRHQPPLRERRQAEAFQYMLDRLQALNLIAWTRDTTPSTSPPRASADLLTAASRPARASARPPSRAPG